MKIPMDAVVFDCDGTLSAIEGIDMLAEQNGVADEVSQLTAEAMGKTGINPDLYEKRLQLVQPTEKQVRALGKTYFDHRVPDAAEVIQLFQRLKKSIYIISAGLYPAVAIFAELLKIPRKHVFAVDIQFDKKGNFLDYEKTSPLVSNQGKKEIVLQLKKSHPEIIYVGDGLNDLAVIDVVSQFVGYGGIFYRESIAAHCEHYIKTASLSPLVSLALTSEECQLLTPAEKKFYRRWEG